MGDSPANVRVDTGGPPPLALWDGCSDEGLAHALAAPAVACVEAGLACGQEPQVGGDPRCSLGLTLTAHSAYRFQVARLYVEALAQRMPLSNELRQRIRTALQEAVINAVVHGNLALGSGNLGTMQEFAVWQDGIAARLARDPEASSAVCITAHWSSSLLVVAVRDSGAGFKRDVPGAQPSPGNGRGLSVVAAFTDHLSILQGSNTLEMGFRL
jgi:hypothetical protein